MKKFHSSNLLTVLNWSNILWLPLPSWNLLMFHSQFWGLWWSGIPPSDTITPSSIGTHFKWGDHTGSARVNAHCCFPWFKMKFSKDPCGCSRTSCGVTQKSFLCYFTKIMVLLMLLIFQPKSLVIDDNCQPKELKFKPKVLHLEPQSQALSMGEVPGDGITGDATLLTMAAVEYNVRQSPYLKYCPIPMWIEPWISLALVRLSA